MFKLTLGVGINDGKYPTKVQGKHTKEYISWRGLLARCYDPFLQRKQPTYLGCTVSDSFKNFSYFHEWCQNQIGFDQENYHLDKDLLNPKDSKLYSETTCLFLPSSLNLLLITCKKERGSLPIGVTAHRGKFEARCRRESLLYIGIFNTPELAFQAYKQAKEAFIKTQAEKWKALIDPRAYAALMAYEVSITD